VIGHLLLIAQVIGHLRVQGALQPGSGHAREQALQADQGYPPRSGLFKQAAGNRHFQVLLRGLPGGRFTGAFLDLSHR
jgi:hypothetical protein